MDVREKAMRSNHTALCPHCKKMDYIIHLNEQVLEAISTKKLEKIEERTVKTIVRKLFTELVQSIKV